VNYLRPRSFAELTALSSLFASFPSNATYVDPCLYEDCAAGGGGSGFLLEALLLVAVVAIAFRAWVLLDETSGQSGSRRKYAIRNAQALGIGIFVALMVSDSWSRFNSSVFFLSLLAGIASYFFGWMLLAVSHQDAANKEDQNKLANERKLRETSLAQGTPTPKQQPVIAGEKGTNLRGGSSTIVSEVAKPKKVYAAQAAFAETQRQLNAAAAQRAIQKVTADAKNRRDQAAAAALELEANEARKLAQAKENRKKVEELSKNLALSPSWKNPSVSRAEYEVAVIDAASRLFDKYMRYTPIKGDFDQLWTGFTRYMKNGNHAELLPATLNCPSLLEGLDYVDPHRWALKSKIRFKLPAEMQ